MTRIECERLVEHYLEGSMDLAAEQDFFIEVALNDELRRTLKSYKIVEETIRKERELGEVNYAAIRRVVAASLLTTPEPHAQSSRVIATERRRFARRFIPIIGSAILFFGGLIVVDRWSGSGDNSLPVESSTELKSQAPGEPAQIEKSPNEYSLPPGGNHDHEVHMLETTEADGGKQEVKRSGVVSEERSPLHRSAPSEWVEQKSRASAEVPSDSLSSKIKIDSTAAESVQPNSLRIPVEIEWNSEPD